jgi:DNA-binding LacI/PurR family transcriptional regulator
VSQILNGKTDRFPRTTRQRVLKAAAELSYRPSQAGRALKLGVSEVILVVVPNVTFGRHLQDAVDDLASEWEGRGYSVVVRYAGANPRTAVTTVLDIAPSIVIDLGVFTHLERSAIREAGTTLLPDPGALPDDFVDPNFTIGRLQAMEVARDPRRRLVYALLEDAREDPHGPVRLQGARAFALEARLEAPLVIKVPLVRGTATRRLADLVAEAGGGPVGICCYNDEVALALLGGAQDLGLAVPGTVALVGADATDIGQLVTPRLTSVAIDTAHILKRLVGSFGSGQLGQDVLVTDDLVTDDLCSLVQGETS